MGIVGATIQDEIWVGAQPNHIKYDVTNIFLNKSFYGPTVSFLLGQYLGVEFLDHKIGICSTLHRIV